MKVALITGVTGQDGSYLAELLMAKGYRVHGLVRRASSDGLGRISHLLKAQPEGGASLELHTGDLTDSGSLIRVLEVVKPDEVYNLAAQTDVAASFEAPSHTADVNALGVLRLLQAIHVANSLSGVRFYQASTSELFGTTAESPQSESTPFRPRSPYGISKLHGFWTTVNFREAYGMFAANGILFNHESPRRGQAFVTKKITRGLVRTSLGLQPCISLGNLDARRDWGHAREYVRAMWQILQAREADDFVIATGVQSSVRDFVRWAAEALDFELDFRGTGLDEIGVVRAVGENHPGGLEPGQVVVRVDPRFFRPAEVSHLCGDPSKAARVLGWRSRIRAADLCAEMVRADLVELLDHGDSREAQQVYA